MLQTFDDFWRAYPRREGKLAALREWERLKPQPDLCEQIEAALKWQVPRWSEPRFIPHPRTWLHQGRWMDEPPEPLPHRAIWQCPHEEHCGHRAMCDIKLAQPGKYPLKGEGV